MAGIMDVARFASVSTATVSRVLSHPDRVASATRERVLKAVETLGYQPNVAARALRTLRASKILLTVPDISNPFFANIIRGAEAAAREAGYALILGDTRHDPELENQYAAMVNRREVDGLIFLGHRVPETLHAAIAELGGGAPVINGCEFSPDMLVSSVHIDNAAAAGDAMTHLLALGHQRIGIITGPLVSPINQQRLDGAMGALHEAAIAEVPCILTGDYSVGSGFDRARQMLAQDDGLTAMFCFSDDMAIGAVNAIFLSGRSCPGDVSVVGFDDITLARYVRPSLTTIAQPMTEIGETAVGMLLGILAGDEKDIRHKTLPHRLIVRESCAPARR